MKKITLILLATLAFTACKKDKTTPPNSNAGGNTATQSYVKFKVNGVQEQFNIGFANISTDIEQMGMTFNNGSSSNMRIISFVMDNIDVNTLKTYEMNDNGYNSLNYTAASGDVSNNLYAPFLAGAPKGNTRITITKIKDAGNNIKFINGTFSAKLYNKNGGSVDITEGEFFESRTN